MLKIRKRLPNRVGLARIHDLVPQFLQFALLIARFQRHEVSVDGYGGVTLPDIYRDLSPNVLEPHD